MRSLSAAIFVWKFCKVVFVSLRELEFIFFSLWTGDFFRRSHHRTSSPVPLATNPFQIHFCSSEVQGEGEIHSLKLYPTSSIFIFPLPLQANFGRPQQIPDTEQNESLTLPCWLSPQSKTIPTRGDFSPFSPRILIENHNEKILSRAAPNLLIGLERLFYCVSLATLQWNNPPPH